MRGRNRCGRGPDFTGRGGKKVRRRGRRGGWRRGGRAGLRETRAGSGSVHRKTRWRGRNAFRGRRRRRRWRSRRGRGRGKFAVAAGGAAESAGALDGVGGVEDHGQAFLAHPEQRAHVGDEVVVAEGGAALGDDKVAALEGAELVGDVDDVPRREELALLHVDRAAGFGGGFEQVGLAAEEGGICRRSMCSAAISAS
jgi:hypothetical protein